MIRSKRALSVVLVGLLACLGLILIVCIKDFPGHEKLKSSLLESLVVTNAVKNSMPREKTGSGAVLYVLGGNQSSLEYKFKVAAGLYHRGLCDKIMLLSVPGITEYDSLLGRNLTNDEWATRRLIGLGVPRENIEPVVLKKGFFGTLSEAKGLRVIAYERRYSHIILVTSSYHTRRTLMTFSSVFAGRGTALSVYPAAEPVLLRDILYEYLKLILYKSIVLHL